MGKNYNRRDAIKATGIAAFGLGVGNLGFANNSRNKHEAEELEKNLSFHGKTAFVTGGARGIGKSIALELARLGANICLYDIASQIQNVPYPLSFKKDLVETHKEIGALEVGCLAIEGDVRSQSGLDRAMEEAARELGGVDIVIANAGITQFGDLLSHTDEAIQNLMDINLGGVAKTIKAAIPYLKRSKAGRIISISSITGRSGSPNFSVYASTKWGVIGLAKTMALELGRDRITSNVICPTIINTKLAFNEHMMQAWGGESPNDKEGLNNFLPTIQALPSGVLEPIEIAKAAVFLCSDAASQITGSVLDVDAGTIARNLG